MNEMLLTITTVEFYFCIYIYRKAINCISICLLTFVSINLDSFILTSKHFIPNFNRQPIFTAPGCSCIPSFRHSVFFHYPIIKYLSAPGNFGTLFFRGSVISALNNFGAWLFNCLIFGNCSSWPSVISPAFLFSVIHHFGSLICLLFFA